ncbi:AMP-binding protein, partial [Roseomonas hellenica]
MMSDRALQLARRFAGLPAEKRRLFLGQLRDAGIDFGALPIPPGIAQDGVGIASPAQRQLWFLWQMDPQGSAYNITGRISLSGPLDEDAFDRAIALLLQRHAALRTRFREDGEDVLQEVRDDASAAITRSDLTALDQGAQDATLAGFDAAEASRVFDLTAGPLACFHLIRLSPRLHHLQLTLHHIIADGWSMRVLIEDLVALYDAACGGPAAAPAAPVSYADFAQWQSQWLHAGEGERQLAYWTQRLGDGEPLLALPTDRPRPPQPSHRGGNVAIPLTPALTRALQALGHECQATLFMVVAAAFSLLLHRHTGQRDIPVGMPNASRHRPETARLVGLFVNMQVLRTRIGPGGSFRALLGQLRDAVLEAQGNQDLPFEWLVEALRPVRSLAWNPLFQVTCSHEPATGMALRGGGLVLEPIEGDGQHSKFDLTLTTTETLDGGLVANFRYARDLFDHATVEAFARHFETLLTGAVASPDNAVGALPLLSVGEAGALVGWGGVAASDAVSETVVDAIAARAAAQPDAEALVFGSEGLSYAALEARANRLAWRLRDQGVGPDVVVGLAVERSIAMVVGLLAILKAGGAWLPLDPDYPPERLSYMVRDAGLSLVLTQRHLRDTLPAGA